MSSEEKYHYLSKINNPADLKKLDLYELDDLCSELRHFIIENSANNPGHLGSSLGVIELTVALHYCYDIPFDNLVWDVGHQSYAHKILTGRKDDFANKRKFGGISGFPNLKESPCDCFGAGHSSISISAALGFAIAAKLKNENRHSIAVIGDGALTGGEAFEGLNNAGVSNSDILIILNDNEISIDKSIGALNEYLTDLSTSKAYNNIKNDVWNFLERLKNKDINIQKPTQKLDNIFKSMVMKSSNLFEALHIRYFGPIDGHNIISLHKTLKNIKEIKGPKLLHIFTTKGKGFKNAENNPTLWHSPGKFNIKTGEIINNENSEEIQKYQDVFGDAIVELAKQNKNIVAITPAMLSGSSLQKMKETFPDRCFDVGIAEQHAVTFAAGLATQGIIPYCVIYSSFAQRAYDQIIHDVALQNLHVVLCLDRAGIVGEDGATHQGIFDLSFARCIPNLCIAAPANEFQLRNLLYSAQLAKNNFPIIIRYPRGKSTLPKSEIKFEELEIGKGFCFKKAKNIAIIAVGHAVNIAKQAINLLAEKNINVSLYDFLFIKPLDIDLLNDVFENHNFVISVEDNVIAGGFGSAVSEFITDNSINCKFIRLGVKNIFVEHGERNQLIADCYFDANAICEEILNYLKTIKQNAE